MSRIDALCATVLHDRKITRAEVDVIREMVQADGTLDLDDVKLLVELLCEAKEVCAEFDELFFPILKKVLLTDGKVSSDEQFYLLKMLYSDGHVRDCERKFLAELKREVVETTPEFEALCKTAAEAPAKNWEVGGRSR